MSNFRERDADKPGMLIKLGIAGAIGVGAVVSGLLISRRGRRLVKEAWEGRRRTRLEDRVLDALWGDDRIGHRIFDAQETEPGTIVLTGTVRARRERTRAVRIARAVKDVQSVRDELVIEPGPSRRARRHPLRRRRRRPNA